MNPTAHLQTRTARRGTALGHALVAVSAVLLSFAVRRAEAQATAPATRPVTLQMGADGTLARSGTDPARLAGYGLSIDADGPGHLGLELAMHQLNAAHSIVYERTYEAGLRFHWKWHGAEPYARASYGRGVFNFPPYASPADPRQARANLAYNLLSFGTGLDRAIGHHIVLRAGATWQQWFAGNYPTSPLPGSPDCPFLCRGIRPAMFSVGAAFRLPAGRVRRK